MAAVLREYVDDGGRSVVEYDNGAVKDSKTGYWVQPAKTGMITPDNARQMLQKRKEMYATKTQKEIARVVGEHYAREMMPVEAAATVTGMLVRDIVLNDDAKHRDRREMWSDALRFAGLWSPNDAKDASNQGQNTLNLTDNAVAMLRDLILAGKE